LKKLLGFHVFFSCGEMVMMMMMLLQGFGAEEAS
jgi:hypothetical protein